MQRSAQVLHAPGSCRTNGGVRSAAAADCNGDAGRLGPRQQVKHLLAQFSDHCGVPHDLLLTVPSTMRAKSTAGLK
jgi:hypothetical protein